VQRKSKQRKNEPVTHGKTYSEAAQRGQEVLEMFIEHAMRNGEPLPQPLMYAA